MGVEGVALEDEGEAAFGGWDVVDALAVEEEGAGGDVFEAGDEAEEGGFAAAGGADEDGEFLVADGEVDAAEDLGGAEGFADLLELDGGQSASPWEFEIDARRRAYLTAPKVRPRTSCF